MNNKEALTLLEDLRKNTTLDIEVYNTVSLVIDILKNNDSEQTVLFKNTERYVVDHLNKATYYNYSLYSAMTKCPSSVSEWLLIDDNSSRFAKALLTKNFAERRFFGFAVKTDKTTYFRDFAQKLDFTEEGPCKFLPTTKEGAKIFVDKSKAMAVATLIDGELEDVYA